MFNLQKLIADWIYELTNLHPYRAATALNATEDQLRRPSSQRLAIRQLFAQRPLSETESCTYPRRHQRLYRLDVLDMTETWIPSDAADVIELDVAPSGYTAAVAHSLPPRLIN